MSCGLSWAVPPQWGDLSRQDKIGRITDQLRTEMDGPSIDTTVIRRWLDMLAECTAKNWRHRFITTNWDYLLQREIQALNLGLQPNWMADSHVYHLNGTVEDLEDNSNRSVFLLEEDPTEKRTVTPEANMAYNYMCWDKAFVVVGMSFECQTDKFLLTALNRVADDLPIGDSTWFVINPDIETLERSCHDISKALPDATIREIGTTFDDWLHDGLPHLHEHSVLSR